MNKKTLIIAEAGVNHNGSLELAKKLVDVAKECDADVVKFQTGTAEKIISKYAPKASYQRQTTDCNESQLDMVKKILLPLEDFFELKKYCDSKNIEFLSTPFDMESIDFLNTIGMNMWKVPSGEVTNLPYLIKIARTGKPIIVSTGMCNIDEIKMTVNILRKNGAETMSLLHCTTEYPTPMEEINLRAMDTIKNTFNVDVGYSDHSRGVEVAIAAVARGAKIIEKHFTLDRNMEGPDHMASLEPKELKEMIKAIRNIEKALGSSKKEPTASEQKNILVARKSIVAKREIKKGETFTENNITVKRPGTGISPMRWFEIIGMKAKRSFKEDEMIEI